MALNSTDYVAEIEEWRAAADAALRQEWVGLAGRFALQQGSNRLGTASDSVVLLPPGSAAKQVGDLVFENGALTLVLAPGVKVRVNGEVVTGSVPLRTDVDGGPDVVTINALTLLVIVRGPRTLVRVRDNISPALQRFGGRQWFPVNSAYRVEGVWTPYDPPKELPITNILGDTSPQRSPGFVTFTLDGHEHRLDATGSRDGGLVLHFRDGTNRTVTYGGGRSVVTERPEGHLVVIDFNRTSNLPCAVTEFATCPLPPPQNTLNVRVEAGEKRPAQRTAFVDTEG